MSPSNSCQKVDGVAEGGRNHLQVCVYMHRIRPLHARTQQGLSPLHLISAGFLYSLSLFPFSLQMSVISLYVINHCSYPPYMRIPNRQPLILALRLLKTTSLTVSSPPSGSSATAPRSQRTKNDFFLFFHQDT